MDLLVEKILKKDPTAMQLAEQLGKYSSPALMSLVSNEDEIVRELAIRSLNQTGGGGLDEVFINALADEMPSVRAAALNGLRNHLSEESYAKLLAAYPKTFDQEDRQEIALLMGKLGNANVNDLKKLFENEESAEALEGCLAALAKLGDHPSRLEFLNRLREAENQELKRFLEYIDYINQIWALRGLFPVLDNKNPIAGSGFCQQFGNSHNPAESSPVNQISEFLRACDIALNLISKIAEHRFPFPVNGAKNYAEEELAEAKSFLYQLFSR